MTTVIITIHIILIIALIILVLLQRSEGGALGMGGGGGGGGGGLMSARGAANAMTRTTAVVAAGFFVTSIALGMIANRENRTEDVLRQIEGAVQSGVPTEGGATTPPAAGSLLDQLNQESGNVPSTGVPTSE